MWLLVSFNWPSWAINLAPAWEGNSVMCLIQWLRVLRILYAPAWSSFVKMPAVCPYGSLPGPAIWSGPGVVLAGSCAQSGGPACGRRRSSKSRSGLPGRPTWLTFAHCGYGTLLSNNGSFVILLPGKRKGMHVEINNPREMPQKRYGWSNGGIQKSAVATVSEKAITLIINGTSCITVLEAFLFQRPALAIKCRKTSHRPLRPPQ